jgi:hypothetical protein
MAGGLLAAVVAAATTPAAVSPPLPPAMSECNYIMQCAGQSRPNIIAQGCSVDAAAADDDDACSP